MILVDTSVLIDYFKGIENEPVALFDWALDNSIPYGICDFVYQELLQGSRSEAEFLKLNTYLETIPFYYLQHQKESYGQAAFMNVRCPMGGVSIRSTIDLLIAQIALENDLYLLHNDKNFDHMKTVLTDLKILKKPLG